MDKRVLIVMPAFNEEDNIRGVIHGIRSALKGADILTVNDGSKDATSLFASMAGSAVIDLPYRLGYGNALQTGYKYALKKGYDYLIQLDADGQHDPCSLPALCDEIKKGAHDIIIGSRFIKYTYNPPLARRIGMVLFAKIGSFMTRQGLTDPVSGFRAFNKKAIRLFCTDLFPSDFPDVDLIIMSKRAGLKIKEIPVLMHPARNGKSMHSGLKPAYYIFKMILSIAVTNLRRVEREKEEA
ncbi:MAG: glycosyltransferase family 2 protein [Candidatus Omnitrophota bacterium]|jgi:glycosyltransferase involved in cell wall biosynthesis